MDKLCLSVLNLHNVVYKPQIMSLLSINEAVGDFLSVVIRRARL